MKISDKGLQEILSLGLKKETSTPGVYFLYEWDDVKYVAVPNLEVELPSDYPNAIKVVLTPSQYDYLGKLGKPPGRKESLLGSDVFKPTTDYFESTALLVFDSNNKVFTCTDHVGNNSLLINFKCDLQKPSPLKIMHDTQKPFHGLYHQTPHFNEILKLININPENLWLTAYPLISTGVIIGAVLSVTNKAEVSAAVLDKFKLLEGEYTKALTL